MWNLSKCCGIFRAPSSPGKSACLRMGASFFVLVAKERYQNNDGNGNSE